MRWDVVPKLLNKAGVNHRISTYLAAVRKQQKDEMEDPTFKPPSSTRAEADDVQQPPKKKSRKDDDGQKYAVGSGDDEAVSSHDDNGEEEPDDDGEQEPDYDNDYNDLGNTSIELWCVDT